MPLGVVSTYQCDVVIFGGKRVTAQFAAIAVASSGANQIVAAQTAQRILLLQYNYMANGTVNAKWQSAANDLTGLAYLIANTGKVCGFSGIPWCVTNVGEALNLNLSGNVAVGGEIAYAVIA